MSYQIPQYKNSLHWISEGFTLSTGKKILMALTGMFLLIFLLVHLAGNLLLLKNDTGAAFNEYSEMMSHSILIRFMEVFLFSGFIVHIAMGIIVTIRNKKARGKTYYAFQAGATSSFFSRHMAQTGIFIFIFLVLHLNTFFVEHKIIGTDLTMYDSVITAFNSIYYTIFYVLMMILLSFHLLHGFQSAFQSLGLNHNKYTPIVLWTGKAYSIIVPFLFAMIPVIIFVKY